MSPPPVEEVAFLFTDIEGSTRLWEEYPDAMRGALARHDAIIKSAIARTGGHIFKTMGDAFCAAFPTTQEALDAALSAQSALTAEPWETHLALKVRMALHRGESERRAGDYFGPPVNRVARLLAAGHGGQVLLSDAARGALRGLPADAALINLGNYLFKDLTEPMTVWQLNHPALAADFPPLRSQDYQRNNLPASVYGFIGREREVADVQRLLNTRLVTITGIGGTGKTRLVLHIGESRLADFSHGVWFVPLAPVTDTDAVALTIANALDIREIRGEDQLQSLCTALRERHMLLILDNCEHLLKPVNTAVEAILRHCPRVTIVATSREPIGVVGEQVYPLAPLSEQDAVRLFTERALLARPNFAVAKSAPTISRLCRRLDNLPLALELAAARVRVLSLEQIEERLDDRFRLLSENGESPLRTLVEWSHELLNEREQMLLARLSVFSDGWTLEAAETVCADECIDRWAVLDLLTELLEKSLLIAEDRPAGARYRMLETLRQYARERLEAQGGIDSLLRHHADYYRDFAEQIVANPAIRESEEGLQAIEAEYENLRSALDYYGQVEDGGEAGMRLAVSLGAFWLVRGHYGEGRGHYEVVMSHPGAQEPTPLRARCANVAGNLAYHQGDYEAALTLYRQALDIHHQTANVDGTAVGLNNVGSVYSDQEKYDEAYAYFKEALAIRRRLNEPTRLAGILINLGNLRIRQGDIAGAVPIYQEAYDLAIRADYPMAQMYAADCLGYAACMRRDPYAAREWYAKALPLSRDLGNPQIGANILLGLAFAARLDRHATVAARFSGAQEALREEIGAPMEAAYREEYSRHLTEVRVILGDRLFTAIFRAGRSINRDDVWTEALRYAVNPDDVADDTVFGV